MISAGVLLAINEAQQTKISIDQAQQTSNLSIHSLAAQNSISKTVADSTAASLYCTLTNLLLQLTLDLFLNSLLRRALRFSYKLLLLLLQQNPNSTRCAFSLLTFFFFCFGFSWLGFLSPGIIFLLLDQLYESNQN